MMPATAGAQVTPDTTSIPDPEAPDTVLVPIPPDQVASDTIPTELREAARSSATIPAIPPFPDTRPVGWYAGRWTWDREELGLLPGITVFDFLEQIPGVTRFRAGGFGRPAGLTALATGGARLRVILDGFEVDPLGTGSFQLESLALLDLNRVTVERTVSEIRVEIETFRLRDPEPYSIVELGTGASQNRLLRALFSRGLQGRSELTGVFDIASTGGIGVREDYSHSNAAFRWSHGFDEDTGIQLEWRRTAIDRAGTVYPQALTRSDLIVRTRRRLGESMVVEGVLGRSSAEEEGDPLLPATLRTTQAALRGAYATERLGIEATTRVRGRGDPVSPAPALEGEVRALFRPTSNLRLEADSRIATAGDSNAAKGRVVATFSPRAGLSLFGSLSGGSRLAPFFAIEEIEIEEGTQEIQVGSEAVADLSGIRAGAEMSGRFGSLGAAFLHVGSTRALPFGLAFDRGSPAVLTQPTAGAEAYVSLSIPRTRDALRLEGWYTRFAEAQTRIYTPISSARAALVFHSRFYDGQLEPSIRLEGLYRGSARVPTSPGGPFEGATEPYQMLNFSLGLRIIDVRAFLIWDNLLSTQTAVDLPGVPPAFPRIVYGASWQFTN